VATVGPLSQNEVIANALSTYVTTELFNLVAAEQVAQEMLPPDLAFLSGPAVSTVRDVVIEALAKVIQSDQFNAVWVAANRAFHEALMVALRGGTDLLYIQEGQLILDLSGVLDFVQSSFRLGDLGLVEEDLGKFVLYQSPLVAQAQQILAILDGVGKLLPLLTLITFVVAWLISLWRRQTLLWIGVGAAITMALTLLVLAVAQPLMLAYIPDPTVRLVGEQILGILLRLLIIQTVLLMVIGALLAFGAWVAGPHPSAVQIRGAFHRE
jgi:hypothetical protein